MGEDDALKQKHELASHSRTILEIAMKLCSALTEGEDSLFDRIAEIRRSLLDLERIDPEHAEGFLQMLENISESVSDLSSSLNHHAASVELDESEFQAMEERMRILQTLKRRYGPSLENVLEYADEIRGRIDAFENAEQTRRTFRDQENALFHQLQSISDQISLARREAAGRLISLLSEETRKLGFRQAEFQVDFSQAEYGPGGCDKIQILFSANPGVPLRPLKDVASSGEISRVMLAAKTVLAEADCIPTLIFDEIDANIGGETAGKVGQELRKLSRHKQIICISHSPMVASCAECHFLVMKRSSEQDTRSTLLSLSPEERLDELCRMLGGGSAAREHARAMLEDNKEVSSGRKHPHSDSGISSISETEKPTMETHARHRH